jgi:hypothetical protein
MRQRDKNVKKIACSAEARKLYQQIQMTNGRIIVISYAKSDRVRFP